MFRRTGKRLFNAWAKQGLHFSHELDDTWIMDAIVDKIGIFAVVTGNENDITEPPDAEHSKGNHLDNRWARPADVESVNSKEPEEDRQEKSHSPAFLLIHGSDLHHRICTEAI